MNNKDFLNVLDKRLNNEEITLPESLSAENVERLINEKGGIIEPKRPKEKKKGKVIKIITSVAAVFAFIIGVGAAADVAVNKYEKSRQDVIIADNASASDYSKVETAVLNYYKELYNSANDRDYGSLFDGFAKNEAAAENTGTVSSSSSSAATGNSVAEDAASSDTAVQYSSTYSSTNVQVSGVDEGDIIKTDGRYIYYMTDEKVVITDCAKPESMNVVSEIDYGANDISDYYTAEMYLYGDMLIMILNQSKEILYATEELYTTDVCCTAVEFDTVIRVYDISDKENPELYYSQFISGDYVSSRVVDGKLIVVSSYSIPYSSVGYGDFEDACEELKEYSVPVYSVNGGEMQKVPSERLELLDEETPTQYVVTALIDLKNENTQPLMNACLGGGSDIYCTQNEMFIAEVECSYWTSGADPTDYSGQHFNLVTHIYKFDITDEGVLYNTDVKVGGSWLNQFSMDKYGEYFRIVTNGVKLDEKGYYTSESNMLYILDKDMKVVGQLDGIAVGEDIKSARFMGNTLYLVTFYQTDPLFIIDLTDPTAPVIKGELKIPGFSSYLHPIGNNLVIGVGDGGTLSGTDGSAKVSLFDVSDPCNPKEIDNYTVAQADFNTDHKAFMAVDEDTFALCLTEYFYDRYYNYSEKYKVVLFDVTENGITVSGEYGAFESDEDEAYYTQLRSAFMGDMIFTVNNYGIKSYSMATNELLGELKF